MSSKNAIVVVDIKQKGSHNFLQYNLESFKDYSKRTDAELIILSSKKLSNRYSLHKQYPYQYLRFEKNQIYELFNKYNRILRLDNDTIIKKECPNLFDLDPSNFYATREDVGSKKLHRTKEIQNIQTQLGIINGWDSSYFNSGVVLASAIHKEAFNLNNLDLTRVKGGMQEQSVLNWLLFKLKLNIVDLGPNFNFMKFFEDDNIGMKKYSYIIHYAGGSIEDKVKGFKKDLLKYNFKFVNSKNNLF